MPAVGVFQLIWDTMPTNCMGEMSVNRARIDLLDMIWPETGLQVTTTAPVKERDTLTEDDQKRKMELIVKVARDVWGET